MTSTAAQTITARLTTAGLTMSTYTLTGRDGDFQVISARNGIKVVTIRELPRAGAGMFFVTMSLDYGDDGRTHCDAAQLKSPAAIVRRALAFTGRA